MQAKMLQQDVQLLLQKLSELGAFKTGVVAVKDIVFNPNFRKYCVDNYCGKYGKYWTCPPDAGEINELISFAKQFDEAIIYQTTGKLESSVDQNGIKLAENAHQKIAQNLQSYIVQLCADKCLHLGTGGCNLCEVCTRVKNEPCISPQHAIRGLSAFGIDVSHLSKLSGMKYDNGQNTVTFFGAVIYNKN